MGRILSEVKKADAELRKEALRTLKKPSKALYTENERKMRQSLQQKIKRRQKKIESIEPVQYVTKDIRTMQSIRHEIGQDELAYDLNNAGYFQDPDYSTRDFREWMTTNGDTDFLDRVLDQVNPLLDPNAKIDLDWMEATDDVEALRRIDELNDEISSLTDELNQINTKAQNRKNKEMLKYMNKKYRLKHGYGLLEAIEKGEVVFETLSDPEKKAVGYLKNVLATNIVKNIDFSGLDPERASIAKNAIYTSLMGNPIQGIKAALRGNAVLSVTKKYGNNAGELAGGMMDFMTSALSGNPNVSGLAGSIFNYAINKSKFNRSLMNEMAESLVDSGKSTNQEENGKMFARDILIDIAKDVITSGGNAFVAIPKIIKDIVIDFGQYEVRDVAASHKDNEKRAKKQIDYNKEQEAKRKIKEKLNKAAGGKNFEDLSEADQEEVLAKFLQ